ncbi:hypothetical protein Hanom_Chr06g00528271 [Helianthus anomalus]
MKVKTGSKPVPRTPKVGTELVLLIFWFDKFGTGTQYHLLISDNIGEPSSSRSLAHLSDIEASSSRVFRSSEVVLKIARAELELHKNMTSRARAQSSLGSARLVYTLVLN